MMRRIPRGAAALGLAAFLLWPIGAQAHRVWLLPSATVLSGSEPWVTVDAAVSNDLFYFEHQPLRLDGLTVTAPDGSPAKVENQATGRYRSTFDLRLAQPGTYRLAVVNDGVAGSYKLNGETKRFRGPAGAARTAIPEGATEVRLTQVINRVESFVTVGKPGDAALKPVGRGLELAAVTHPNSLVAGEPARFRLLIDGKPAPNLDVTVVPGGIRYRDTLNEAKLRTDGDGVVTVTWPGPGMYWLNATHQDDKSELEGGQRRMIYNATLEVMPQ